MNILFWNVNKRSVDNLILDLVLQAQANIVVLAEHDGSLEQLVEGLTATTKRRFYKVPQIGCRRISVMSDMESSFFHHRFETDRYSIIEFQKHGLEQVLFGFVHLPSKLYMSESDQLQNTSFFIRDVQDVETNCDNGNTILLGDFNMNPFDPGMTDATAVHSIPSLATAMAGSRTIRGREHKFFYNPCWNLLGDRVGPAGTHFYSPSGYSSLYWHVLDQVVLRPSIGDRFDLDSLRVITTAGTTRLTDERGRPSASDHLPISFCIDLTIH